MKKYVSLAIVIMALIISTGCNGNKNKDIDYRARKAIVQEVDKMNSKLPMSIENSSITLESVSVDDDMVTFVSSMPSNYWEEMFSFGKDAINSDKNVARVIKSVGDEMIKGFVNARFGITYIYQDSDSGKEFMRIEADCDRLKKVLEGMESGDIKAFTSLEIFQMEIDKYTFPMEIGEGTILMNAYIRNNTVYYITKVDADLKPGELSESDISELKTEVLSGLKQSLIAVHKNEMAEKGISIVYIYNNFDDEEIARVRITADDL